MPKIMRKCRCCLVEDEEMKNMYVETISAEKSNMKIADGFRECSGLDISDLDLIPNNLVIFICYACEFQLKNALMFRIMCQKSNEVLMKADIIKTEVTDFMESLADTQDQAGQVADENFTSEDDEPLTKPKTQKCKIVERSYKKKVRKSRRIPIKQQKIECNQPESDLEANDDQLEDIKVEMLEEYAEQVAAHTDQEVFIEPCIPHERDEAIDFEAMFYCYHCSQYFQTYRLYCEHRKEHENIIRQRECEFCKKTVSGYTKHIWRFHPDFKPYKCIHCPFTTTRGINLKRHLYAHTENRFYKCLMCDISFKNSSDLRTHINTAARHRTNNYNCPYCGLDFQQITEFVDHSNSKHAEVKVKPIPCYHCKRIFHMRRAYDEHLETCEKAAGRLESNKRSQRSREAEAKLCELCDESCVNEEHLLCHNMVHHNDGQDTENLQCPECEKTFSTAMTFKRHQQIHGIKNYQCDQCGMCLSSASRLKNHQLKHSDERNVKCELCQATFKHKTYLKTHMKVHQPKKKDNECNECGRRFATVNQVKLHMAVHFDKLKVHACELCDRRFVRRVDRRKHMLVHRGERNFKCQECNKSYYCQFALKEHNIRVHAEFKFECKFCGKKYARNKSLYEHIFTHLGIKPHTCPGCQAQYVKKELFKKHMRKRHGIEYDEKVHGYKETFQQVLMHGLKTDNDNDFNEVETMMVDDNQDGDENLEDTQEIEKEDNVKIIVLEHSIVEDEIVLEYTDLNQIPNTTYHNG